VNILESEDWVTVHNVVSHDREAYMDEVAREMDICKVDLIGISAGFDNHEMDWGSTLRTDDYGEIGHLMRSAAQRSKGGCFALLEGDITILFWGRM
jgi:acetoin utilization deacetylase AcuC-like enzyme